MTDLQKNQGMYKTAQKLTRSTYM